MRAPFAVGFLLLLNASAFCQSLPEMSISLAPGASLPLGENATYFSYGAGAELTAGISAIVPFVSPRLSVGYDYVPLASLGAVHFLHAGAGVSIPFSIMPKLRLSPYILGGYTYGMISNGSGQGGGPFVKGGVELALLLNQLLSLGLDASYRWDIGSWGGFGISLYSGVSFPIALPKPSPGPKAIKGLELLSVDLAPVFPALFKLYDVNPFGTLKLHNLEKSAITDLTVDFYVGSYMDNPTRLVSLPSLEPNGEQEVKVKALFSEGVLRITEATKVSGKVSVNFVLDGQPYTREFSLAVRINNRNSITWDDTRKAATFVTPNDPLVLTLGKSAVSVTADVPCGQVDKWLTAAMALHEALRAKGLRYSTNPNTPFSDVFHNASVVDSVWFPQEELSYGAGNCSDLTVLYCSLLEAVGAHTAFITTPGHIYAAVQLDVPPDQVNRVFSRPQDLIVKEGKTWMPVEVTLVGDRFLNAWQTGAQEWREFDPKGQTEFLPVAESWQVFEPVGQIPALGTTVKLPDLATMAAAYRTELNAFIDQELQPRVAVLRKDIASRKNDPKPLNSLGVVYAQFGKLDMASTQFEAASRMGNYVPALINLAGVRFLAHDYGKALDLYAKANGLSPHSAVALLGLARTNAAMENYGEARAQYDALKQVNPDLARQFAYLGEQGTSSARAASADAAAGRMTWDEGGQ
jgi:hypothetical protein